MNCFRVAKGNFKKQIRAVSKAVSKEPLAEVAEENEQSLEGIEDPVLSIEQTIKNKANSKGIL